MALGAHRIFLGIFCALLLAIVSTAYANPAGKGRDRDDRHGREEKQSVSQQLIEIWTDNGLVNIDSLIVLTNVDTVLATLTEVGVRRNNEDRFDMSRLPVLGGLFGGSREPEEAVPSDPVRIGTAHLIGSTLAVDLATPPSIDLSPRAIQPIEDPFRLRYGKSLSEEIRELVALRPRVDPKIFHALSGSEFAIEEIRVLNDKYSYSMPASAFATIGNLRGTPTPDGGRQLSPEQIREIRETVELIDRVAGDAYLEESRLTLVLRPTVLDERYGR